MNPASPGTGQRPPVDRADRLAMGPIEASLDAVLITNPDGQVLSANSAACALFGLSEAEIIARGRAGLVDTGDPRLVPALAERARTGRFQGELTMRRGNGERFTAEISTAIYEDDRGEPRTCLIIRDRTVREQQLQELRRQKDFARQIFDSSTAGMAVVGPDGLIVDVNEAWVRFAEANGALDDQTCGVGADYFRGLAGGPDSASARDAYAGLREVQSGRRTEFELLYSCEAPDAARWYRMRAVPLSGQPGSVLVSHVDETARVRAEQDRQAAMAQLQQAQRLALLGFYSFDALQDRWVSSPMLDEVLGIDPAAFVYDLAGWLGCVHPDDRDRMHRYVLEHVLTARQAFDCEYRIVRQSDRAVRVVHGLGQIELDGAGRVCRLFGTIQDVTALKQLEKEKLVVSKLEATGMLAAGIAHDFNNLVTSITLGLESLLYYEKLDDPVRAQLDSLKEGALSVRDLTAQLLQFAATGEAVLRPLDLGPVVRKSLEIALSGTACTAHFDDFAGTVLVEADEAQVAQVFRSLARNAGEAMPAGGKILVAFELVAVDRAIEARLPPGDYLRVTLVDQGAGISEEDFPRIFDPYFSTKQRGTQKGMGLGLTICRALMQNHRGAIQVKSNPGAGTAVAVYFPACRPRAEAPGGGTPPKNSGGAGEPNYRVAPPWPTSS